MMNAEWGEDPSPRSAFSFIIQHSSFIISSRLPMLFPTPPQFRRRRARAKASPTPPPALANQIVSVAFGPGADQLTVTVGAPVVGVQTPSLGLWVFFEDGDPVSANAASVTDDTH